MTWADAGLPAPNDAEVLPTSKTYSPEDDEVFREARMLLLFQIARSAGRKVQSVDRLGYYEFFADSPYIVVEGNAPRDTTDLAALESAGFSRVQLSYASSGPRYMSRRRRLQRDLARLVALGLVQIESDGYAITEIGDEVARQMNSVYADAYRIAAQIVLRRLAGMSNKGLEASAQRWLGDSWLLVDLLDDVNDAEAPSVDAEPSPIDQGVFGHG